MTAASGVTIPYYLLSHFFVESLEGNNSNDGNVLPDSQSEDCEKKLLAIDGNGEQQLKAVMLLPPTAALTEHETEAL
jgi:hypothetical protein